jgi:hypothetical protein
MNDFQFNPKYIKRINQITDDYESRKDSSELITEIIKFGRNPLYAFHIYQEVFGYGDGTGDYYFFEVLSKFFSHLYSFDSINKGSCYNYNYESLEKISTESYYNYQGLEKILTPNTAWLLINQLGNANLIEYGQSTRYGWMCDRGLFLQALFDYHVKDDLLFEYFKLSDPDNEKYLLMDKFKEV